MLRFTTRDLLWLVAVSALSINCIWLWLEHYRLPREALHAQEAQATAELLAAELNEIGYDITVTNHGTCWGSGPFKNPRTYEEFLLASK